MNDFLNKRIKQEADKNKDTEKLDPTDYGLTTCKECVQKKKNKEIIDLKAKIKDCEKIERELKNEFRIRN